MALVGGTLYVANTDALVAFPYKDGQTEVSGEPRKVADLPGGDLNHHWTKNIIASRDGTKLYATVGSNSNVGENGLDKEENRAAILEVDVASGGTAFSLPACAIPMEWAGTRDRRNCGLWSMSATKWVTTSSPTT